MATFAQIQTAVSKRLLDASNVSISVSDVADSINETIAYWKFYRFWFNDVTDQVTLIEQDATIPFTGDILVFDTDDDGVNVEYSNMRYTLKKISPQVYDNLWLGNGYGMPQFYTRIGQEYKMYPLPDRDYTMNRHYLKEYQPLVNPTDTNDFTVYANRLIMLWTLADMTAEFQQDDKMETYYRNAANNMYRQLKVMNDKSNGSGKLTLHSNLII